MKWDVAKWSLDTLKQLKQQLTFAFFPVQKEAVFLKDKLSYMLKPQHF